MTNPKFILSKSKVIEQYNKVKEVADIVSYSSKTNQVITPILETETKAMFTVHFINELKHIKNKSKVFFLAQGWTETQIQKLIDMGIKWFGVDNETDLDVFIKFLESNDLAEGNASNDKKEINDNLVNKNNLTNKKGLFKEGKINLLLRIKLKELTLRTERYFVFGMKSKTINQKIKEIKSNEKLKNKIGQLGIHFHRKTQNMAEWNYTYEVSQILDDDVLEMIDVINMGGGLPSEYANTNVKVLPTIFQKISEFREWLHQRNIKLIIEPGRFIAAPSGKLVTKIIAIHDNNIIVNASVYNSDMDALIVPVKLLVDRECSKEKAVEIGAEPYVIKGITPCSMDLFRYRVYLDNPKVGDKLVFINAGAYNFTTDFCDLDKVEVEVVE